MVNYFTPSEQIFSLYGVFPNTWEWTSLGVLFEPVNIRFKNYRDTKSNMPVLSMTRAEGLILQSDKFDKRVASMDTSEYKVVEHGDLVYGFPMDEGVIAILYRFPVGVVSPVYQVLRPKKEMDRKFFDLFLRTQPLIEIYKMLSAKVVERRRMVSIGDFMAIEIPIPPISEQRKIASTLAIIQQAMDLHHDLIQVAMELKKALMKKLFSEGLRGEHQKETDIGLIPRSWEVSTIGQCCKLATGTTPSTSNSSYYTGANPFIKTSEIVNNRITSASTFISDEAISHYHLKVFPPGTLLLAMYGQGRTRGQVSILKIPASTSQNAAAIQTKAEIQPEYLWHYLVAQYERLRKSGIEGHISHLNLGFLRQIKLPVPSTEEQREIANLLDTVETRLHIALQKKALIEELWHALEHKLMTAQIRVDDLDLAELEESVAA